MKVLFIALFAITVAVEFTAQGLSKTQTSDTTPAVEPKHLPTISEIDKDKLALIVTKRKLLEQQAALAKNEYEKTIATLQDQFASLTEQLNAKADEVFKKHNLDRTKYDINLETGKVFELNADKKQ